MVKRQLNEDEQRFSKVNLEVLNDELDYIEQVQLPTIQHSLNTADIVFKRQIKQLEKQKNNIEKDIKETKKTIDILTDQIENGVEEIVAEDVLDKE